MPAYEHGNFQLDYTGNFPDQLKLIKSVTAFLLEFTATGSLNPRTKKFSYSIGCRDVILNGKLTYDANQKIVEYKKVLPLPVLGGMTKPVISAQWQIGRLDNWHNWRSPRLQLGLAVDDAPSTTDDGANLNTDGSLSFRRKMFVTRRWGVEVDGDARFSLQHDVSNGSNIASSLGLGVTAKELNVVCRI